MLQVMSLLYFSVELLWRRYLNIEGKLVHCKQTKARAYLYSPAMPSVRRMCRAMCSPDLCALAAASDAGEAPLHVRALEEIERGLSGDLARAGDMEGGPERAPVDGGVDIGGFGVL